MRLAAELPVFLEPPVARSFVAGLLMTTASKALSAPLLVIIRVDRPSGREVVRLDDKLKDYVQLFKRRGREEHHQSVPAVSLVGPWVPFGPAGIGSFDGSFKRQRGMQATVGMDVSGFSPCNDDLRMCKGHVIVYPNP